LKKRTKKLFLIWSGGLATMLPNTEILGIKIFFMLRTVCVAPALPHPLAWSQSFFGSFCSQKALLP
jgi:hypothetical protein